MKDLHTYRPTKQQLIKALIAIVLTLFWVVAIRFVVIQNDEVHYHANFAVFVDGVREPFDLFTYYEEVESCSIKGVSDPKIRVHMHDQIGHVVHVHDEGATWGHFFANLSWFNGDTVFKTLDQAFVEDDDTQIRFLLNGEEVQTTANRTIGDLDVLLISIGDPTNAEMQQQYDQIQRDAALYNEQDDPTACSGGRPFTIGERFRRAINIFEL